MNREALLEAASSNPLFVESLYQRYLENPRSLDPEWVEFFEEFEQEPEKKVPVPSKAAINDQLIEQFRTIGHLYSKVNCVSLKEPSLPEELSKNGMSDTLKKIYCGSIGFEFKGIVDPEIARFIEESIEPLKGDYSLPLEGKQQVMQMLNKAELFESFLHMKYPGQKRFSLEGAETLIPMLWEILERSAEMGAEEFLIGMAHRGRLNVLANILNKSYEEIFREFDEGYFPDSFEGTGDVKYHKGFLSDVITLKGHKLLATLVPNPSHLESVNPVLKGTVKGKQIKKRDVRQELVIPVLVHGDAAIAGQGVVYETLQLSKLPPYSVGGTFHIVVNNQIGFTTSPEEGRSTRYCTDIAKTFGIPIFHVNAEDPEGCVFVCRLAAELRRRFKCDVFIELNCYRKYGHNESDEPAFTQPLLYKLIRSKKTVRELYRERLISEGVIEKFMAESMEEEFKKALSKAQSAALTKRKAKESASNGNGTGSETVETAVSKEELSEIGKRITELPSGFVFHPKLQALLKERLSMAEAGKPLDWGMGEFFAYASILWEGQPLRLAGQDSGRGTFTHRHALWVDQERGESYSPLMHLKEGQGRADVINTPLSEYAALGFEYGYSLGYPETLVLWEAQFGDFANGGQVVFDQYISSGEQKWGQRSAITLLLPHGYEGQGPEHSSARIERFLSLAGHDNMRLCNPTTPAQFFHLIRSQAKASKRLPLVVFTPKVLLRHPDCKSSLDELASGGFLKVIDDLDAADSSTLCFCSGKIYYELKKASPFPIIRIEQLYPFPKEEVSALLAARKGIKRAVYCQEEPANMGAWRYIRPRIEELLPKGVVLEYNGREASASPAAGSYELHKRELSQILDFVKGSSEGEEFKMDHLHRA